MILADEQVLSRRPKMIDLALFRNESRRLSACMTVPACSPNYRFSELLVRTRRRLRRVHIESVLRIEASG